MANTRSATLSIRLKPATKRRLAKLAEASDRSSNFDGGQGLPEALLHGNLLHAPDHVIVGAHGPVAINFAWLM